MVLGCVESLRERDYLCQVSKEASKQQPLWIQSNPENTILDNVIPWWYDALLVNQNYTVDLPQHYDNNACDTIIV